MLPIGVPSRKSSDDDAGGYAKAARGANAPLGNPRFVVTSIPAGEWAVQDLCETFCCARGEMENRIKEQIGLFPDWLSTDAIKGNQLRLRFSSIAYALMEVLPLTGS